MMKYTPDFSSRFRILKGGKISLVVSALVAGSTMSFASPTGGQVTTGSATINQSGSVTTINQSTNKASINWNSFSIAPSETVNFVQPSSQSVILNRVIGTSQSLIQGAMNANGQVFLLNPNGVLFTNGSQINVGGLVASTLNITDANFQAGNYVFEGNSQNSIINMGTITASNGGYVAMMGKTVQNEGTIVATMGNVQMASGEKISLNLNGNSLVKLTIDQGTLNALVENKGLIKADGGQVYLTTQALNTILDGMVNNTGIIEAKTLNDVTSKVILFAHGGTTNVSGTIDATGGFVETSGKELSVASKTVIKAKKWLIDPVNVVIESTGGSDVAGSSISATAIETALESADVQIEATNDITVNDAIDIVHNNLILSAGNDININANVNVNTIPFGMNYYGLLLMAGNDINVNAIVDVRSQNVLGIAYGFDGSTYNTTSRLNMGMNGGKTAFTGKINLVSDSIFYMNEMIDGTPEYTIISDRAGLEAIDDNYAETLALVNADGFVMQDVTDALGRKYVLGGDIDLSGRNWLALGDATTSFTGTLNALGHTIDGMTIYDADLSSWDKGLFSSIYGGSVSNLALTNVDVNGLGNEYGALAGWAEDASISNIILQGSVKGDKDASDGYFGGLTGYTNNIIIDNVHANVDVEGSNYIGGLVGYGAGELTITNSSSKGNIKFANQGAGGLVGYFDGDSLIIEKSFNAGSIGAMADTAGYSLQDVGGLVGCLDSYGDGYIRESFNTGDITGTAYVGGIVGYLYSFPEISNTFNTGTVTGIGVTASGLGGFIGTVDTDVEISNSYSSGDVTSEATHSENVGGFIGSIESGNDVSINNSFSSGDVAGTRNVGGFIGILTRRDYVELANVSASGTVNGTTNVGGFVGQSGEVETEKIELALTNVNWNSTASGQGNVIGSSFAEAILVYLYDIEEDGSFYVSPNIDNTGGRYTTNVLGGDRIAYNYDTHYAALVTNDVDGEYHGTFGTIKTGDFTNSANITTAQNSIVASAFTAPTWVKNSAINNGLPYFPWSELATTGGSIPTPTPTSTPTTNTVVQNQVNNIVTTIVNSTTITPPAPMVMAPVVPQQQAQTQAQNNTLLQTIMPQGSGNEGGSFGLVGTTDGGSAPVQTVSMEELQQASAAQGGISEIRVPLGQDSFVELVNGGVNLPKGISQEFYVVDNNANADKKN